MPAEGQLTLNAGVLPGSGGVFTYTPGPGFAGHDSFTYTIGDIREPGDGQVGTAEAQVTLLRPVVGPPPNSPPSEQLHADRILRQTADDRCSPTLVGSAPIALPSSSPVTLKSLWPCATRW